MDKPIAEMNEAEIKAYFTEKYNELTLETGFTIGVNYILVPKPRPVSVDAPPPESPHDV